jgi:hypothetical protein
MGIPKIEVDEDKVYKLAQRLWTNVAIASHFDISTDTLTRRFAEVLDKGRQSGRMFLSDKLFELCSKGNLGALVWLTKQHLGYSDKLEQKTEDVTINRTIRIELQRDDTDAPDRLGEANAASIEAGPIKA